MKQKHNWGYSLKAGFRSEQKEGKHKDKPVISAENQKSEFVEAKKARICGVEYQNMRGPSPINCILDSHVIFIFWE